MNGSLMLFANYLFLIVLVLTVSIVLADQLYFKQKKTVYWGEMDVYTRLSYDFLPVILVIMVIRTYLYEPYYVPSQSMYPQLTEGDVMAVSKSRYDIKFPFTQISLYRIRDPKPGEVVVFKYPLDTSIYFVKRVLGQPNDKLLWQGDDLYINGALVSRELAPPQTVLPYGMGRYHWETLGEHRYLIRRLRESDATGFMETSPFLVLRTESLLYAHGKPLDRSKHTLQLTIPDDYYLMVGDNRDQSTDGRSWGLVHRSLVVGEAQAIVLHLDPAYKVYQPLQKIRFDRNRLMN